MKADEVICIYKKRGETPLECLERLRVESPKYEKASLSYAGRLDPMAEGAMLVLVGDSANKNREHYLSFPKVYYFEVLFGFSTDTADILGKITSVEMKNSGAVSGHGAENLRAFAKKFVGKRFQTYPVFSSRTVEGKPLFEWAREGRLDEIDIPARQVEIFDMEYKNSRNISRTNLLADITRDTELVKGDFRQDDIARLWKRELEEKIKNVDSFAIYAFRVSCSSGTYVRALVEDMAHDLGTVGIAYKIVRESVGPYSAAL